MSHQYAKTKQFIHEAGRGRIAVDSQEDAIRSRKLYAYFSDTSTHGFPRLTLIAASRFKSMGVTVMNGLYSPIRTLKTAQTSRPTFENFYYWIRLSTQRDIQSVNSLFIFFSTIYLS